MPQMSKKAALHTPALSPHAFSCSGTCELGKALGTPPLANPLRNPGRNGRCGTKAGPKRAPAATSQLCPWSWAELPAESPRVLLRCPAQGWQLQPPLQSGLPRLSRVSSACPVL